jgi:recyclin-1
MLDERVAAGLNVGIDVLIDEVEHIFAITQQVTDFNPGALAGVVVQDQPGAGAAAAAGSPSPRGGHFQMDIAGPSSTAIKVVEIVESHTRLLNGSTDKNVLDVFNQEVGLRLFSAVCKHIKRQRISVDGAIRLISYFPPTPPTLPRLC